MFRRLSGSGSSDEQKTDSPNADFPHNWWYEKPAEQPAVEGSGRRRLQVSRSIDEDGEPMKADRSYDWPFNLVGQFRRMSDTPQEIKLALDAKHFSPEDLEVRADGRDVTVHCRRLHEADDYGPSGLAESFDRTIKLPENVDPKSIRSHLKRDGTLLIEAKKLMGGN